MHLLEDFYSFSLDLHYNAHFLRFFKISMSTQWGLWRENPKLIGIPTVYEHPLYFKMTDLLTLGLGPLSIILADLFFLLTSWAYPKNITSHISLPAGVFSLSFFFFLIIVDLQYSVNLLDSKATQLYIHFFSHYPPLCSIASDQIQFLGLYSKISLLISLDFWSVDCSEISAIQWVEKLIFHFETEGNITSYLDKPNL